MDIDVDLIFIPILSGKTPKDKKPFHWTLLVCDLKKKRWLYYNSMGTTKKLKPNKVAYDQANMMKNHLVLLINKRFKMELVNEPLRLDLPLEEAITPRQGQTNDCTIYVGLIMEALTFMNHVQDNDNLRCWTEEYQDLVDKRLGLVLLAMDAPMMISANGKP
ncbi:hypothetical protein AQUCO_03300016v1 [Aquilegia coerulea]|uniref:Ubiquitin-like protease family profile domain-containing protein n=1 Tax=Aquilegia coerulea TaxID=218851 RepID=A0A2G5CZ39_AQUCA|nr:hypothetical protein AQUCO_03300016v1 [Aquilegia coerulea]